MFPPKATRDGGSIEERFRVLAQRAHEKFLVAREIKEAQRSSKITFEERQVDEFSDAMGMYIIDTDKKDLESRSSTDALKPVTQDGFLIRVVKFFKNMYTDTKFELKWKEFMCITFCLQVPFPYILRHVNMVYKWGAMLVLSVYVLIGGCIAMPVYMMLMFLGNYSRRSYIRFWECCPILKGVAYSVALTSIMQEVFNVGFGSLCLNYFWEIITSHDFPWTNCNFPGRAPDCQSTVSKGYNVNCCHKDFNDCSRAHWNATVFKFPAYDFFRSRQLRIGYNLEAPGKPMPAKFLFTAAIVWVFIWLMMLIGLKRFRGIMTTINLIILILLFLPLVLILFSYSNYEMLPEMKSSYKSIFDYVFWTEASLHSLHRELAGDVITFSAISSPGISTTVDTICIYTLKFMFLVLISVWVSVGVTVLQQRYNILNTQCIDVDGFMVLYSLFPEIMSNIGLFAKPLLMLYFVVMFYWCFSASVYTLNSFIEALLEEYPKLVRLKVFICGIFCALVCAINLFTMRSDLEMLYASWISETYINMKIVLLFFTLLGMIIYTLTSLSNDFHFTYGQKLNMFWIHGLKVAMLLTTLLTFLQLINYSSPSRKTKLADIVTTAIIVLPILSGAIMVVIKYVNGTIPTALNPDPRWGPPHMEQKLARSKFDPKRELRYRSAIQKCKHSCLLHCNSLTKEIKYWDHKALLQVHNTQ